jgi:hypothetical protein
MEKAGGVRGMMGRGMGKESSILIPLTMIPLTSLLENE